MIRLDPYGTINCSEFYRIAPGDAMTPVSDFTFYWYGAHQFVTGQNPYVPMPGREYVILNPPYALTVLSPLGLLPLGIAKIVWVGVLAALFLVSAKWLRDIYAEDRGWKWTLVLLTVFTPIWVTFKLGQTAPIILFGLVGFLRYQKTRPWTAGAFLFLVAFKPQLAFLLWPTLLLCALRENRWKPLLSLGAMIAASTLCVLAVRPGVFGDYFAMIHAHRAGFYETSTIAAILREITGTSWTQFIPAVLALAWFGWRWSRASEWEWKAELPMLLLVSIIGTSYAWFSDEVILLPAIFAAFGKLREHWEPSALFYLFVNLLGLMWSVDHRIVWLAAIPFAWLAFYLYRTSDLRGKENRVSYGKIAESTPAHEVNIDGD